MKNLKWVLGLVFLTGLFLGTDVNAKDNKTAEAVFSVEMHCKSCAAKVEKNIPYEKGVKDLKVDFEKQTVWVEYRTDKTNVDALKIAFKKIDIPVKSVEKK